MICLAPNNVETLLFTVLCCGKKARSVLRKVNVDSSEKIADLSWPEGLLLENQPHTSALFLLVEYLEIGN